MTEKRFSIELQNNDIYDKETNTFYCDNDSICNLLNEQQELIEELQVSDKMGWEFYEKCKTKCPKELYNKKMYIKRLEYKVQKFKEMNGEQQATITHLEKGNGKNFAKRRLLEQDNLVLRNENEQLKQRIKELEE